MAGDLDLGICNLAVLPFLSPSPNHPLLPAPLTPAKIRMRNGIKEQ